MRLVLTPRRHAVAMKPGERHMTTEEKLASIARGRSEMTTALMTRFPEVTVLGIEGKGEILIELPDDPELVKRIKTALDCETGPAPGAR